MSDPSTFNVNIDPSLFDFDPNLFSFPKGGLNFDMWLGFDSSFELSLGLGEGQGQGCASSSGHAHGHTGSSMSRVDLDFGLGQCLLGRLLLLPFLLPFETGRSLPSSISFFMVFALTSVFAAYHCFFFLQILSDSEIFILPHHRIVSGIVAIIFISPHLFSAFVFVILCDSPMHRMFLSHHLPCYDNVPMLSVADLLFHHLFCAIWHPCFLALVPFAPRSSLLDILYLPYLFTL